MLKLGKSMGSDFTITWTDLALEELQETVDYLHAKFTKKETEKLGNEIKRILSIIVHNQSVFLYQISERLEKQQFLSTMPCIIEL